MRTQRRRLGLIFAGVVAAMAIAIPVVGADPSPSAGPPGQAKPEKSAKPAKSPEVAVTVQGTITQGTDAKGRATFTLTTGGKTWNLSAGPSWFWGDKNPLAASVGKSVTVVGTQEQGGTEVDVETVDGKALRAPGKPPWAGGPWVVGPTHPGWKSWMADGKPGKAHGNATAPGQLKKASPAP